MNAHDEIPLIEAPAFRVADVKEALQLSFLAAGALAAAQAIGRPAVQEHACCSVKTGNTIKLHPRAAATPQPVAILR